MNLKFSNHIYEEFMKNIKRHFKNSNSSIHKARNEIKIVCHKNEELVIKSFKIPHIINKIVYTFFKDSKAKKSYQNSLKVGQFAPKPVGYIEFRKFGLICETYFVSSLFKYEFTIREPLTNSSFKDKQNIFEQFAMFVYNLHQNNILHLDLSPGNVLIQKEQDRYIFKIVDINRMRFKTLSLDDRLKNFDKLWAKDEDMTTMIKSYAKISKQNESYCIDKAIYYSQKNKDFKNFKKRLKGIKVVD